MGAVQKKMAEQLKAKLEEATKELAEKQKQIQLTRNEANMQLENHVQEQENLKRQLTGENEKGQAMLKKREAELLAKISDMEVEFTRKQEQSD